jgi:hypothetical protein
MLHEEQIEAQRPASMLWLRSSNNRLAGATLLDESKWSLSSSSASASAITKGSTEVAMSHYQYSADYPIVSHVLAESPTSQSLAPFIHCSCMAYEQQLQHRLWAYSPTVAPRVFTVMPGAAYLGTHMHENPLVPVIPPVAIRCRAAMKLAADHSIQRCS